MAYSTTQHDITQVEPKIVSVEVKKPVTVKDVRKVKKTQYIKQKAPTAGQKQGRHPQSSNSPN